MVLVDTYCKGEILGNPDISGVGVVWSTWILSFLVILASFWVWLLLYYTEKPEESTLYRPSVKALLALGDTQLITALTLTLTSLLFITAEGDSSLYHIFVARGLVSANVSGYGASLMLGTKDYCNFKLRWIILLLFLVLYAVWTELCIRDFDKWSDEPPLCFQNENMVPGNYTTWMSLDRFWCPVGFVWVLLEPFKSLRAPMRWIEDGLPLKPKEYWKLVREEWRSRGPRGQAKSRTLLTVVYYAAILVFFGIAIILSILTITPPFFMPFAEIIFFSWAVYDVFKVRQINAALGAIVTCPSDPTRWIQCKQNPETQFGFGQIMPFCLLLFPILQLADIYAGK